MFVDAEEQKNLEDLAKASTKTEQPGTPNNRFEIDVW